MSSTGPPDGSSELSLLALDTDRVQDYVYESARLPEVRGASALLDELNAGVARLLRDPGDANWADDPVRTWAADGLPAVSAALNGLSADPNRVIYAAGGSLLAKVPTDRADDIGEALCGLYEAATMVATATHAVCRYVPGRLQDSYRLLGRRLRRRKDEKTQAAELMQRYLPAPGEERCESCDLRKSVGTIDHPGEERNRRICEACERKVTARGVGGLRRKLNRYLGLTDRRPDFLPQLGHIAAESRSRSYLGTVYLDGDGIGKAVEEAAPREPELRRFARRLNSNLQAAVFSALRAAFCQPMRNDTARPDLQVGWYHRFQIVYIGGDDLLLFVPADVALQVAHDIASTVHQRIPEVTLSGGVVISHPHYPVYFLHKLAKELCRSAKRGGGNSVDFEVLRSAAASATDLGGLRERMEQIGRVDGHVERRRLHNRPYTWEAIKELVCRVQALKKADYPKGHLIAMAQECLRDRLAGSSLFMYQFARAREGAQGALGELLRGFECPPPWRKTQLSCANDWAQEAVDYRTPLADIIDLYDVLPD